MRPVLLMLLFILSSCASDIPENIKQGAFTFCENRKGIWHIRPLVNAATVYCKDGSYITIDY